MKQIDHEKIFDIPAVWALLLLIVVPALALGALIAIAYTINS